MIRKCFALRLSRRGCCSGSASCSAPAFLRPHDDETPLGKIMEKVNKHDSAIQKGVRNKVAFTKSQKDVEKSAKELVKLAKEAKDEKDAAKKAKDVANPEKKWDEYIDELVKTSEELGKVAGKVGRHIPGRQGRLHQGEKRLHRLPQRLPHRGEILTIQPVVDVPVAGVGQPLEPHSGFHSPLPRIDGIRGTPHKKPRAANHQSSRCSSIDLTWNPAWRKTSPSTKPS